MNYVVFYSERFDDHTYQDFSSRINKWDPKHKNQRDYSWKVLVLMTNISSCKIFLHNSLWPALAMAFGHCMMSSTKGAKVWPFPVASRYHKRILAHMLFLILLLHGLTNATRESKTTRKLLQQQGSGLHARQHEQRTSSSLKLWLSGRFLSKLGGGSDDIFGKRRIICKRGVRN